MFDAAHFANQTARLAVQIQIAQAVTRIMPRHAPFERRAYIIDAEHVDQERSKLVGSFRNFFRALSPDFIL